MSGRKLIQGSVALLLLLIALAGLLSLLWPGERGLRVARQGAASVLISQLSQASHAYELDFARFPPGDGTGSATLVRCLTALSPRRRPYFEAPAEMLGSKGDFLNPVNPDRILSYRCPGVHNPKTFDLWCEDADGRPDGINNWR